MWNDNDTNIDLIDFNYLVSAVKRIIENEKLVPCTIGIFGDWGSGKSSLMKMAEQGYQGRKEVVTIKFNGWIFEGYEDAKSVLMGTILETIVNSRTLEEKAKKIALKLFKKIDWFRIAKTVGKYGVSFATMGPAGLGIAAISDIPKVLNEGEYEKFIKKDDDSNTEETLRMSIREFHNDFAELLKETKISKLIIFIDDLDRCNPDTVIETLEAIKLFLYVDNTVFVISADEHLIKYAVSKRFPEIQGIKTAVSRDYLEKLIQYPIRIPQLGTSEIETYINLLFTSLHVEPEKFEQTREKVLKDKEESVFGSKFTFGNCEKFVDDIDKYPELKNDLFLSSQITPLLAKGLNGNPRQCKRFLNMLMMRFKMSEDKGMDIQKRILSKLMLLEYFKEETFKNLFDLQMMQNGIPKEIKIIENKLLRPSEEKENENEKKKEKYVFNSELIETWIKDRWLTDWFRMEPFLNDVNLSLYFYLSRDKLTSISSESHRMSSNIQELFTKIISESDTIRNKAIEGTKSVSETDSSAIFSSLVFRINETENTDSRDRLISTLTLLCHERKELLTEVLSFLEKFPVKYLSPAIVPQLRFAVKDSEYNKEAERLISQWGTNMENKNLAKAINKGNKS
ncbi:MAG: KAP family P-loop NTPase fold protein [Ignavibacteriaceae bacterium]